MNVCSIRFLFLRVQCGNLSSSKYNDRIILVSVLLLDMLLFGFDYFGISYSTESTTVVRGKRPSAVSLPKLQMSLLDKRSPFFLVMIFHLPHNGT